MLTHTDVHYLVGILTEASSTEDVEIELGDMVYDVAAEKKRDVDVTVTYKDDKGQTRAFIGIEVKDHGEPLDVTHVEQLIAKLSTMPAVTQRSIVSASGYTKAARLKAKYLNTELCELKEWDDSTSPFDQFKILPGAVFTDWIVEWHKVEAAHVILPNDIDVEAYSGITPQVCNAAGEILINYPTIAEIQEQLLDKALGSFIGVPAQKERIADCPYEVEGVIEIAGDLYLNLDGLVIPMKQFQIVGEIIWRKKETKPILKVIIRDGEERPFAGSLMGISVTGDIHCITVSRDNRSIRQYTIPISERNKDKIRRMKNFEARPFAIAPL